MSYEKFYPNGWQSGEAGGTPITPEALNHIEEGIMNSLPATERTAHPGCYFRTVDGEAEWVNPPLNLGEEYRITERWQGKAVYTKLINCGSLGDSTTDVITTIPASAIVLRHHETLAGIPLPFYYPYAGTTLHCEYNNDANFKIIIMYGHPHFSTRTVTSQAWYTKN